MDQDKFDDMLIESFLRGELPKKETTALNRQLRRDPDFRRRVKLHQLLGAGLRAHGAHEPYPEAPRAPLRVAWRHPALRKGMVIAAGILLLALAAIKLYPLIQPTSSLQQLMAQAETINFSIAGDNDPDLAAAVDAYNAERWTIALAAFDRFLAQSTDLNHEVLLYRGIALRQAGQLAAAEEQLTDLVFTEEQHYAGPEARWQLALTYAAMENYPAARQVLTPLLEGEHPTHKEQARKLLRLLADKGRGSAQ